MNYDYNKNADAYMLKPFYPLNYPLGFNRRESYIEIINKLRISCFV